MKNLALIVGCLVLGGCAAHIDLTPLDGVLKTTQQLQEGLGKTAAAKGLMKSAVAITPAEQGTLDQQYVIMQSVCLKVFANFEGRAERTQWALFATSIGGTIAGAVVGPALQTASVVGNKVWVTAFSGIGGGANAAQQTIEKLGLSGTDILLDRAKNRKEWQDALADYWNGGNDYEKRLLSLQKATL